MASLSLQQRRDRALGAGAELFYDEPVEIVRGEGCYLYDRAGRRYVDLYNNVPCVGHGNPAVARAMGDQQATLNVHNRYLHEGIVTFAERLTALHHEAIESVVFSCSGTEANDVALRMARLVTGRRGILCTDAAYHGNAGLSDLLTSVGLGAAAGSEVRGFPFPDCYRPPEPGAGPEDAARLYLERATGAIDALEAAGHGLAALILCPILANEGLPRIPPGLLAQLAALVRSRGGLVIADEVQCGYGRTGCWWGYELEGLQPDIVVMGKPMGNGLPLAATAARRHHVETFRAATDYFNTFASSPLQAAVGMAVLDEIERRDLVAHAGATGERFRQALAARLGQREAVGEVRGRGLFLSVELVRDRSSRTPDAELAGQIANDLREHGYLTAAAGAHGNVIKIRPPLVFDPALIEPFADALDHCLAQRRA